MKYIHDWILNKGKLAHSPTQKLEQELHRHGAMLELYKTYAQANKVKPIPVAQVESEEQNLPTLHSNDGHIIALAKAGNVQLLVSEDEKLKKDFKEFLHGKVFPLGIAPTKQQRFLSHHSCP